jgi:hypothetical protein
VKFDEIKIIEDKYLPEGFMLIEDSEGTSFFEIATGKKTLIPKFTLDVELPREYTVEGDKIFGNLIGTLRFPR